MSAWLDLDKVVSQDKPWIDSLPVIPINQLLQTDSLSGIFSFWLFALKNALKFIVPKQTVNCLFCEIL